MGKRWRMDICFAALWAAGAFDERRQPFLVRCPRCGSLFGCAEWAGEHGGCPICRDRGRPPAERFSRPARAPNRRFRRPTHRLVRLDRFGWRMRRRRRKAAR